MFLTDKQSDKLHADEVKVIARENMRVAGRSVSAGEEVVMCAFTALELERDGRVQWVSDPPEILPQK